MYRVISDLYPDRKLPIVCGMQHQYRKALRKPFSHLCHVNIIPIAYPDKMRGKSIELLNTMARGKIIIRGDDANDLLSVNAHIMNEFLLNSIGKNTFEVSYTGRVPFCGLDKYISDFTPIIDLRLSGGLSIEIFSLGEDFCVNIMQRNADGRYTDRFIEMLAEIGIKCEPSAPRHFEINDFVLPE